MRMVPVLRCVAILAGAFLRAEQPSSQLPPDARVAIIGDSITEQKLYSKFIETYLLACTGRRDIHCFQFGWGGETAMGFSLRLENDLAVFHPNVATLCYGMNDGGYVRFNPAIGENYEKNMRAVLAKLQALGVKRVVVGSPGAVDTKYFAKPPPFGSAADYNDNLAHLRDSDLRLAGEFHLAFADVHREMEEAMTKAKAVLGEAYDVCGKDGVHPGPNGHLLMASAFLKALGLDGNIGEIAVDMKGQSTATEGHHVTGGNGQAFAESTRWPFCFEGDLKSSSGTRSILAFCKFNDELNRLVLRVKNLEAAWAKVTWETETREFTRAQLEAGINLPAEFPTTPFDHAFFNLMNAVRLKQEFETPMIKNMITHFRGFANDAKADPEMAAAFETLKKKLIAKQEKLDAAARAFLASPVKHTIKVETVK